MKQLKFIFLIIFLVTLSCKKEFPELSSLEEHVRNDPEGLQKIVNETLESGIFDHKIHFASGGDLGLLDDFRNNIQNENITLDIIQENIHLLAQFIGNNVYLTISNINPGFHSKVNEDLKGYINDLITLKKYYTRIDSLKCF